MTCLAMREQMRVSVRWHVSLTPDATGLHEVHDIQPRPFGV